MLITLYELLIFICTPEQYFHISLQTCGVFSSSVSAQQMYSSVINFISSSQWCTLFNSWEKLWLWRFIRSCIRFTWSQCSWVVNFLPLAYYSSDRFFGLNRSSFVSILLLMQALTGAGMLLEDYPTGPAVRALFHRFSLYWVNPDSARQPSRTTCHRITLYSGTHPSRGWHSGIGSTILHNNLAQIWLSIDVIQQC